MTQKSSSTTTAAPAVSSKIKSRIHFCGGNKGGVGKSTFARTLHQWHLDRQKVVLGVDCDAGDTPDFLRCCEGSGEVITCRFSDDPNKNDAANVIINLAEESPRNIVVNLPATVHKPFKSWLDTFDIVELARDNDIQLVHWFVTTGEFDSVKPLEISLNQLGKSIPHVVVKNLGKSLSWEYFESETNVQQLIADCKCKVIDLPLLMPRIASTILEKRLSLGKSRDAKHQTEDSTDFAFGVADRSAIKKFLNESYLAFESTGYLPA